MSEILCTFHFLENNSTNYFLLDKNVSYSQFRKHITNVLNLSNDEVYITNTKGNLVSNIGQLKALYSSDFEVFISRNNPNDNTDLKNNKDNKSIKNVIKEQKQEDNNKAESFVIGDTIKSILSRFNVIVNDNEQPKDIIKRLPRPLPRIIQRHLTMIEKNPKNIENIVNSLSKMFDVSSDDLLIEIKQCIDNIKQSNDNKNQIRKHNCISLKEKLRNRVKQDNKSLYEVKKCDNTNNNTNDNKCDKSVVIHPAICDNCQKRIENIRFKCFECNDYDLCELCEQKNGKETFHDHIFVKLYKIQSLRTLRTLQNKSKPKPNVSQNPNVNVHPFHHFHRRFAGHGFKHRKFERITKLEESISKLQEQVEELSKQKQNK